MKKLAIIGYPASHSLSPAMHNFISDAMGHDYRYRTIDVPPGELSSAVESLRAEGISGFNVTAPHKVEIMQYLDEISPEAESYGAVNTVVNRGGRLYGYNTDAAGFYRSLLHSGINPVGADILILGAGGAAQPVTMYLAQHGAGSISVQNRTQEKAEELREKTLRCCGFEIDTHPSRAHYDIVINCTSLGMGKNADKTPLADLSVISEATAAADMIYSPPETVFLRSCRERGAKTVNGMGMLVYQGILAYELFSGCSLPEDMADRVFNEALKKELEKREGNK